MDGRVPPGLGSAQPDLQRFANHVAAAIHDTAPDALVTVGAWSFKSLTDDDGGAGNMWSDEALIDAGGRSNGVLDFYQVHYYDWASDAISPFMHPASHFGLDKLLVVGEFHADAAEMRLPSVEEGCAYLIDG